MKFWTMKNRIITKLENTCLLSLFENENTTLFFRTQQEYVLDVAMNLLYLGK